MGLPHEPPSATQPPPPPPPQPQLELSSHTVSLQSIMQVPIQDGRVAWVPLHWLSESTAQDWEPEHPGRLQAPLAVLE